MNKFILLNDLHLSEHTEETVFSILSYAASEASKSNACVAILGDFYDTVYKEGLIDARLQQRTYNFFSEHFTKEKLFLLPGNHDIYNGYQETALSVFNTVATVYDTPTLDTYNILWLPYRDGGYSGSQIRRWKREGATTCFTHNDFKYLSTRKNHMSRQGMDPAIFDGIKVFNGHYHYPSEEQNVICMGSQYVIHKTETFDQKRLYTVEVRNATFWQSSYHNIRFGRREFVYPLDYAQDLHEMTWCPYLRDKVVGEIPPPTYPTIQDTLVIEYSDNNWVNVEDYFDSCVKCPIIWRPEVKEVRATVTNTITMASTVEDNIMEAVKILYHASPESLDLSLVEIGDKIYKEFRTYKSGNSTTFFSPEHKKIMFLDIKMQNFCGVSHSTITYDAKLTKIKGENGVGKTVQYPTAFLYCMTGVMDGRFSEERILLTDMRLNRSSISSVKLNGKVNDIPFTITRTYDGKKTKVEFILNGVEIKASTLKKKQKQICIDLFNAHVADNVCPHRFLHKLLLQRVVWKQGGRDSDFLKMNSDAFQTICLETMNKGDYGAFIKYLKTKISTGKKKLEKHKNTVLKLGVVLNERKQMSTSENLMLNAWCDHRRDALNKCKEKLRDLEALPVSKDNIDAYMNHHISVKTLQNRVKDLVDSKEGTRWNPEFTLNKLEEALEDMKQSDRQFKSLQEELNHYVRCLESFKYILNVFYTGLCKVLKEYNCNIDFMISKKTLLNGQPMKYLSGGEYEHESLKLFITFQRFVNIYAYWNCNLMIFDEPGTAMSTESLQQFIDNCLTKDQAHLVITHKAVKCPLEVYFN